MRARSAPLLKSKHNSASPFFGLSFAFSSAMRESARSTPDPATWPQLRTSSASRTNSHISGAEITRGLGARPPAAARQTNVSPSSVPSSCCFVPVLRLLLEVLPQLQTARTSRPASGLRYRRLVRTLCWRSERQCLILLCHLVALGPATWVLPSVIPFVGLKVWEPERAGPASGLNASGPDGRLGHH